MAAHTHALNIFLLKKSQTPTSSIVTRKGLRWLTAKVPKATARLVYVSPTRRRAPWLDLLEKTVAQALPDDRGSALSAVLFVEIDGRTLAFAFGHGRHLFNPGTFEPDFGLRVALNRIDPTRFRSVDHRSLEEQPLHAVKQIGGDATVDLFGIDVSRDVLRSVTGQPAGGGFAYRMSGSDSLLMSVPLDVPSLATKARQILKAYAKKDYRKNFAWVDDVRIVKRDSVVNALFDLVAGRVRTGKSTKLFLTPPKMVDWERVDGFLYPNEDIRRDGLRPDLDVDHLLAALGADAKKIKKGKRLHQLVIRMYPPGGEPPERWPLADCISTEVVHRGRRYALSAGQWYRLSKSLVERIERAIKGLARGAPKLPAAKIGEDEGPYNARVAPLLKGALLDKKLVRCKGARTRMEPCDLFLPNKQFVFVKKGSRSSKLSHLFLQGTGAGDAFRGDESFRESLKNEVTSQRPALGKSIPLRQEETIGFTAVFAVIAPASKSTATDLPFLSKLSAVTAAEKLRRLGFKVLLSIVPEQ